MAGGQRTGLWGTLVSQVAWGRLGFPPITRTDGPAAQGLSHGTAQPSVRQFRGSAAPRDPLKISCFGLKEANQNASGRN